MEGNACYKWQTINKYVHDTGKPPVKVAIDIGAGGAAKNPHHHGAVTKKMAAAWPEAVIYAYEPGADAFELTQKRVADNPRIKLFQIAITGKDHGGEIELGLARKGQCWQTEGLRLPYSETTRVESLSLDQMVVQILTETGLDQIDVVKFDCEKCEIPALGEASPEILSKIQFIVGEYHGKREFYDMMRAHLLKTHRVFMIGGRIGAFFAERRDEIPGLLKKKFQFSEDKKWMWNPFRPRFVPKGQERNHGL